MPCEVPSTSSCLSHTISSMMVTLEENMTSNGEMSRDLLLALHSIFGSILVPALDLVDRRAVTLVKGENSGREVITVRGSNGTRYTLLKGCHYCPCPSYQYKVLGRGDITCKHLLAMRLALAMQRVSVESVQDSQILDMIQELSEISV